MNGVVTGGKDLASVSMSMKSTLFLGTIAALATSSTFAEATYHHDIAPIIYANCTSCHRDGESAPFPLSNFEEVSKKARTIKRVVNDRYMPPWHASPELTHFADVRRLAEEEILLINHWVEAGKPEGNREDAPPLPEFPEGWQLGEPDIILTMKEAYPVPAEGPDVYRNFVLPLDLPEDKWVKAIELRPSARAVVHHSLYFLDDSGTARKLDGKDGKPGFHGMSFRLSGSLGGYVPGVSPKHLPGDLARPLPKGSDLVLSTHFHPSGKVEMEQTNVGIYLADKGPTRQIQEIQIPPGFGRGMGINIPAGEDNYTITDSFTLPVDTEAVSITGHAHYIAENMNMTAKYPDGKERVLLDIPDWDLDWQDNYFFNEKIILPAGTVLTTTITYDNSENNYDNPFSPPKRIKWGRESTDEMGSITLLAVPTKAEDITKLTRRTKINQAKIFAQLGRELSNARVLERFPTVIKFLDKDMDGSLQSSELPERLRSPLLLRLDTDKNKILDASELKTLQDWLESMEASENA